MKPELRKHVEETLLQVRDDVELRSYSTFDFGRERNMNCLSIVLPENEALERLPDLRHSLSDGLVAFLGTNRWLGSERHEGVEVVVAEADNQFDMVRIARTEIVDADMEAEDIIDKLKSWDEAYGISILRATTDTIEFTLHTLPSDLAAFAEDVYDFCGDVEDPSYVESQVRTLMRVYLWWD